MDPFSNITSHVKAEQIETLSSSINQLKKEKQKLEHPSLIPRLFKKAQLEKLKSKIEENLVSQKAIRDELRKEVAPIADGLKIIRLQKNLEKANVIQKQEICKKIASLFKKYESKSFAEMLLLRNTVEGTQSGTSALFKLVYNDVDVETCHTIIRAINQNAQAAYDRDPANFHFVTRIYSDVDDTLFPSLNDRDVKIKGTYPSALEFYKQLNQANPSNEGEKKIEFTLLSARPNAIRGLSNSHLKKKFPDNTHFHSLYGTAQSFSEGIKHYTVKALFAVLAKLPSKRLRTFFENILASSEFGTFFSFAMDKRQNIDRDLLLRPEARGVMVGDTGEGDLLFMLMKNSGSIPLKDERIPEEYHGPGEAGKPVNPTLKPLSMNFAHALSSRSEYRITPNPQSCSEELKKEINTTIIHNYVDAAIACLDAQQLNQKQADAVVQESRLWLENQDLDKLFKPYNLSKAKIKELNKESIAPFLLSIPPHVAFRVRLWKSICDYDLLILKG